MKLTVIHLAVATLAVCLLAVAPAGAGTETQITIPVGDWIAGTASLINELLLPLVTVVVGWVFRFLPASISTYLKTLQVEQLLVRAIGWGLTSVRGATEGKALTFDVGNKVVAQAVQYAVDHAPGLVAWIGGPEKLREKILARLLVAENVAVATNSAGQKVLT